ncbi:MAG: 16S rRNA (guanine(966)-N(2))-methyltransferase RsmD, partial [Candidatus Rokubacteria bacterium]|nr:16S rRNA (guanine(966)-N(2))-methyltransferase RsmD [Candidatus Rokubacteria bacterium]
VAAGELKGRRLAAPKGRRTRPTSDRIRIACLDTLAPWLPGARFLDLFAGAGAVGIEALSRGCAECVFVETDHAAMAALCSNLEQLGLAGRARVLRRDARSAVELLKREGARFAAMFLDPPYRSALAAETLARLADGTLLAPGGVVVVQHLTKAPLPERVGSLTAFKGRRFGETTLTFFRAAG